MSDIPPGIRRVVNDISAADANHALEHVGVPIVALLNQYTREHEPILALYAGLYAMGCALANMGAALDEPVDLRQQLSPLFEGYSANRKSAAH